MREYLSPVQFDNGEKPSSTVYSDRLFQWDSKKHDALCQKHFGDTGQYWGARDAGKIEGFLRDYIGNESLILCKIEQHQNLSNGYPLWRFDYKTKA